MIRKLLKYEIRRLLKIWLAMAVVSILFSIIGGFSGSMMERSQGTSYEGVFVFGLIVTIMVLIAFVYLPPIFTMIRFYTSLYSDEGYLTFTLPVKKNDILLSKLIFCLMVSTAGDLIATVDVIVMALVWGNVISGTAPSEPTVINPFVIPYIALISLILLFATISIILLIFILISTASRFSKVGRVFFIIGTIYGASNLFSLIIVIATFMLTGNSVLW